MAEAASLPPVTELRIEASISRNLPPIEIRHDKGVTVGDVLNGIWAYFRSEHHHQPLLHDITQWERFDGIERVYRTPHGLVMLELRDFVWETPSTGYFAREPRYDQNWHDEVVVRDAVELSRSALEIIQLSDSAVEHQA